MEVQGQDKEVSKQTRKQSPEAVNAGRVTGRAAPDPSHQPAAVGWAPGKSSSLSGPRFYLRKF